MSKTVDFVEELRLRQWARAHYVSANERDESWHSIVLEEMRSKDAELEEQTRNRVPVSSYVPLAPVAVHSFHSGHVNESDPNLFRHIGRFEISIHASLPTLSRESPAGRDRDR